MKTIRDALTYGASFLTDSETPFLDASLLLAFVLGMTKEKLFAQYPEPITEEQQALYKKSLEKRKNNIPIAYILKTKEFYGLSFHVDSRVLIPRPETETLIETAFSLLKKNGNIKNILDLCSGSGCIGITLKYFRPDCSVTCADISEETLDVCRYNSKNILGEVLPTVKSNLFDSLSKSFDMIISNPPYLTEDEVKIMIDQNWQEPPLALHGGEDGLFLIRKIINQAGSYLTPGGYILLESAINQTYDIAKELIDSGFSGTEIVQDLTGRNRVTIGRKWG